MEHVLCDSIKISLFRVTLFESLFEKAILCVMHVFSAWSSESYSVWRCHHKTC